MNPFVFACITPHGGEIIPELQGANPSRMAKTRDSLFKLGGMMKEADPDTIIVLTPHGTRINGQFSVVDSERMIGEVEENDAVYKMERNVDRELAASIVKEAHLDQIPVAGVNYGTSAGPLSCLQLDWGAIVPLRFMNKVPIVVITPSRLVSYEDHIRFGKALSRAVKASGKRVGLIASCDWAHAHDAEGPYGFDPAARQLDEAVCGLIKSNQLEEMANFDEAFIDAAKPDGIWQTLVLAGAIQKEERQVELLSYEAPTYFGLICAAYKTLS